MGENQILVAIKKPGELPGLEPLFENSLEAFQKAVGGYIEVLTVASDLDKNGYRGPRFMEVKHDRQ